MGDYDFGILLWVMHIGVFGNCICKKHQRSMGVI